MSTSPSTKERIEVDQQVAHDEAWTVLVLNDPVTLMSYVVLVLRRLFGFKEAKPFS